MLGLVAWALALALAADQRSSLAVHGAEGAPEDGEEVPESASRLAVTTQVRRYCDSSFRLLAGQFWLHRCI